MIDTIIFRIHGITDIKTDYKSKIKQINNQQENMYYFPSHNELYKKMLKYKGKHFSKKITVSDEKHQISEFSDDEFISLNFSRQKHEHFTIRDMMVFSDHEKTKQIYKRVTGKLEVPSSHHGITFNVNDNANYIDIQTSVPKFLFGHSLAQFVPQVDSRLHEMNCYKDYKWSWQQKHLFDRFENFNKSFFSFLERVFDLEKPLQKKYVELRRLDLCFNQYFESKNKALNYLESLKLVNDKRYSNKASAQKSYDSSLTYQSQNGSYFKIYHKGTEYAESRFGDLKKHIAVNQSYIDSLKLGSYEKKIWTENKSLILGIWDNVGKGKKIDYLDKKLKEKIKETTYYLYQELPYKVDFFRKEMDLILRYEVSLKSSFFNYTYKRKVFRSDCPVHQKNYDLYKKVKSIFDSRNTGKQTVKITRKQKNTYDMINRYLSRTCYFLLDASRHLKRFENNGQIDIQSLDWTYDISRYDMVKSSLINGDCAHFSELLLMHCVRHFYKLVKHYQVQYLNPYDDISIKIKTYNQYIEAKIDEYNQNNSSKMYLENQKIKLQNEIRKKNKEPPKKLFKVPIEMVSQRNKMRLGMKKIRPLVILTIVKLIKKGKSFDIIRNELGISPSQMSRYRADLEVFNITEKAVFKKEPIKTRVDFKIYYEKLEEIGYRDNLYIENKQRSYA